MPFYAMPFLHRAIGTAPDHFEYVTHRQQSARRCHRENPQVPAQRPAGVTCVYDRTDKERQALVSMMPQHKHKHKHSTAQHCTDSRFMRIHCYRVQTHVPTRLGGRTSVAGKVPATHPRIRTWGTARPRTKPAYRGREFRLAFQAFLPAQSNYQPPNFPPVLRRSWVVLAQNVTIFNLFSIPGLQSAIRRQERQTRARGQSAAS